MQRDGALYVDPEVDHSALVAKLNGPRWLRALADAGPLERALRRHFERYGPSPPVAAAKQAGTRCGSPAGRGQERGSPRRRPPPSARRPYPGGDASPEVCPERG